MFNTIFCVSSAVSAADKLATILPSYVGWNNLFFVQACTQDIADGDVSWKLLNCLTNLTYIAKILSCGCGFGQLTSKFDSILVFRLQSCLCSKNLASGLTHRRWAMSGCAAGKREGSSGCRCLRCWRLLRESLSEAWTPSNSGRFLITQEVRSAQTHELQFCRCWKSRTFLLILKSMEG